MRSSATTFQFEPAPHPPPRALIVHRPSLAACVMVRPPAYDELLETLRQAVKNDSHDFVQSLYYVLEDAKPKFFNLFDVPPRNPQEEQAVKKGTN